MPGNPYANTGWWNNFVAAAGPQGAQDWVNQQTGGGGGSSDAMRNQLAQQMPQQALSGGTVQYSTPGPASVAQDYQPPGNNSDIPANLLARMSPTDIMLFRQAQKGQAIPTGVAGPYGGGAMGQPQISSGYNAFSGAGLPATNIGQGGLYGGGYGGSDFFGGGSNPYAPQPQQTPFMNDRFRGAPDPSLTGPSETFQGRFPDPGGGFSGGSSNQPRDPGGFPYWSPSFQQESPGS